MTKKTKPRWGYRPLGFQSVLAFSEEQAKRLAEIAGKTHPQSAKKLHRLLIDEGETLAVVDYMMRSEVSPPEQRAALNVLIDHSRCLLDGLREVDLDTRRVIYSDYPNLRFSDHEAQEPMDSHRLFKRDIDHLERLCRALEDAPSRVPKGSGRPVIGIAKIAAEKLAAVYENFTGELFQVSNKSNLDAPVRFVEYALGIVAPEATDANIRTALRHAVKVLNWRRRNQKPTRNMGEVSASET